MTCQSCKSGRLLFISGKCADRFGMRLGLLTYEGYVPGEIGIGGGDYIRMDICLDCGQVQGEFPVAECLLPFEEGEPIDCGDDED